MIRKILWLGLFALLCLYGGNAKAIDFKAKGQWVIDFDYGDHGQFTGGGNAIGFSRQNGGDDNFGASQRVRLQLEAVASETLSGTVYFEIGNQKWGKQSQGGALGADGVVVELKDAYIDFIPFEQLKVRMGIQNFTLPSFTTTSQIMSADVAGITASYAFNDNFAATLYWIRPWNDNFTGSPNHDDAGYMDNYDFMGLALPITFDGVKITPWGLYGILGPNAFRTGDDWLAQVTNYYKSGLYPLLYGNLKDGRMDDVWGNAWWAGFTGEVTAFSPWRFAWDFNYGSFKRDKEMWSREGWLASALVEYKFDFGTPGIHGWYSSGDDDDISNGSERLPYTGLDEGGGNSFDRFAFGGGRANTFRDARVAHSMGGTWGVGAYIKDVSFIEKIKHEIVVNYFGGTNAPKLIRKLHDYTGEWMAPNNPNSNVIGMEGLYMTRLDTALSVTIRNDWKMYDNFTITLDASYIHPWLDQSKSVWGQSKMNGISDKVCDAWNIEATFNYSF